MITALIRTHPGREELYEIAKRSALNQGCIVFTNQGDTTPGYEYNLYCNTLKTLVKDGWFFFLDSDDYVMPGAIEQLLPYLTDPDTAIIVRMLRNGQPKPKYDEIVRGKIGLPCLVLHSKHKHLADVTATETGDYDWIAAVCSNLPVTYTNIVLVNAGKRNHGK